MNIQLFRRAKREEAETNTVKRICSGLVATKFQSDFRKPVANQWQNCQFNPHSSTMPKYRRKTVLIRET